MSKDGFHLAKTLKTYFQREDKLGAYEIKEKKLISGNLEVTIYAPDEDGRVVGVSPHPRPPSYYCFEISTKGIILAMRSMHPNSNVWTISNGPAFSCYINGREMWVDSKEFENAIKEDLAENSRTHEYKIGILHEDGSKYSVFSLRRSLIGCSAIFDEVRLFGTNKEIVNAARKLDEILSREII